jgi:Amt family ammonium transporter
MLGGLSADEGGLDRRRRRRELVGLGEETIWMGLLAAAWAPYPTWLNPGDNAWQLTAATFVGLMSVPGLVVLYGGVMQKRWSVNSMMLAFAAFGLVLIAWVLWAFDMGFGHPWHGIAGSGFFGNFVGQPGAVLNHVEETGQAAIPLVTTGPSFHFPQSTLVYFQFVFAAITPILMLGSVLGRVNFKAWLLFVPLWTTCIYVVNAFLIWGGGYFAQKGTVDYSGGYVIHLSAGVSGFVAAAVIGPRLARDREIDAPNNLLMVAAGAGLLWLGWNGFNGGDPYYAGADAAAAVLNTNLATAVAFLVWVVWDYMTGRKPSLIGSVNGMIVGLVAITPAAGFVNGFGAIAIGAIGSSIVYVAYNYVSRLRPFRAVDDTLGVIYTHGFAGLAGGLLTGLFADSHMIVYLGLGNTPSFAAVGGLHLLKLQFLAGAWVIVFSAAGTFVLLKLVGLVIPLRMTEAEMEVGDIAVHGHEVYPGDVPSLGDFGHIPSLAPPRAPEPAAG